MKKFVRIQSTVDITVSAGLQSIDMSNKDAHVADRLNVKPAWVGTRVFIAKGSAYYPSELKTWDAVIALQKDNILTIGEEVDELPVTAKPEEVKKAEETKARISSETKKYKKIKEETEQDPQATEVKKETLKF